MADAKDDVLGSVEQVKKGVEASQKDIMAMRVVGEAKGLVRVTLDGTQRVTKVEVESALLRPESRALLEECVKDAFNDAMVKFAASVQEAVTRTLSQLNLGDLMSQLFNPGPGTPGPWKLEG